MASDTSARSARAFCGDALYDANAAYARVALTDVPATDEGLRLLAANGNWSEVLALAEELDAQVAAKARRHPSRYAVASATLPECVTHSIQTAPEKTVGGAYAPSSSLKVASPLLTPAPESGAPATGASPLSTDAAVRHARLPYVLVQVTANLKMRRIVAARKVIDDLGGVEGEGFRHPVTRESFAPFSLRLIAAFLPLYLGVPMEAQKNLYGLLEECLVHERKCGESLRAMNTANAAHRTSYNAEAVTSLRQTWTQRVLRVQRALLHVHIHMNQQSLAHCIVEQVLRTEDVWHQKFHVLSDELYQLRHMLHLQQVFCLSLHVGDAERAREVHRAIRQLASELQGSAESATAESGLSNRALAGLVATSCDAFSAVFQGNYNEAVGFFSVVVQRCAEVQQTLASDDPACGGEKRLICEADGAVNESALRLWTLQNIRANAQVSQATCMAYCSDADPTMSMSNMCTTMEDYVKAEPQVLCNSDPFVESMVRFYTLAGERRGNLERFSDLLEVFRCDRSSMPSLEALV